MLTDGKYGWFEMERARAGWLVTGDYDPLLGFIMNLQVRGALRLNGIN